LFRGTKTYIVCIILPLDLLNVFEEKVFQNNLSNFVRILQFHKVSFKNFQHLILFLSVVVGDWDAVIEVARIGLYLVVHNDHVFERAAVEQDG